MIFVTLFLAALIAFFALAVLAVIGYYKNAKAILAVVYVVSALLINDALKHKEFCDAQVLKICDADRTEYVR